MVLSPHSTFAAALDGDIGDIVVTAIITTFHIGI
jgi:hypothetical protein